VPDNTRDNTQAADRLFAHMSTAMKENRPTTRRDECRFFSDGVLPQHFKSFVYRPGDPHAGSGGYPRMFRMMYAPAAMARLAEVSLTLWTEVETAAQRDILTRQKLLFYGAPGNAVEGDLGQMRSALDELGAPYDWFGDAAALRVAWPVFCDVPAGHVGLAQPNSAVIRVQRSLEVFAKLARRAGAVLLTGQPARIAGVAQGGPYEVSCPAGTFAARGLVRCPSAWTNHVLRPFGSQLALSIWQMTVAYSQADTARRVEAFTARQIALRENFAAQAVIASEHPRLPSALRGRIFAPFFAAKPPGGGMGLGLSLSHDIVVKQHGGTIPVETEPGSFTEFVVTLPPGAAASGRRKA
jgi:hypothetical protein